MAKKFYGGILGDGYWYEVPDKYEVFTFENGKEVIVCECDTNEHACNISIALNHLYQYSDHGIYQSRVKDVNK